MPKIAAKATADPSFFRCSHNIFTFSQLLSPFDTYNLFYRDELEAEVLAPIRAERS